MTADVTARRPGPSPATGEPGRLRRLARSTWSVPWRPEALAVLVAVVALLVQVVGYTAGWADHETAAIRLWYVGFVGLVAPFAWLLLAPARTGHQRLAAAVAFGLVMYGSWLLSDPVLATRFDETQHVTTLVDMIDRHRFFYPNTTLPVSPHYPGLELATAGVHWVTGLPLIASSIAVVLASRTLFVVALFLLASRIGRSTRVGAATVLLYGGSAQFYFFNSQFAYQTVAIAMLMAALYLLVRAFDSPVEKPWQILVPLQVCLAALAVTHHLTSWLTIGLLWVLAVAFRLGRDERRARITLVTAEVATVVVAAWTAVITPLLISYLGPIFNIATSQVLTALDGSGSREPGVSSNGQAAPVWELMVMAGAILLWIALLVPSLWHGWRRGSLGTSKARYVPLAIAAAYPFLQVGRVSVSAAEVTDRASTFVTLALALVVGAWLTPRLRSYSMLIVPGAVVLVLGGTILGSGPDWQRVTGPYLAGAEQRSVDGETVAVAQWAGTYLPADAHVAADSTFTRVLPNFAPVIPLTQPGGFDSMTPLFIAPTIDQNVLRLILQNDVDFIVVDTRLVGQTARSGAFFEGGTGYAGAETVQADEVTKFQDAPGFHLILDGPVKVYDVRGLRGAPETFPTPRQPPGIPGTWTPWQVALSGLLLAVALALRGGLLDPRRFRARDTGRIAVLIPAAMVLGAVGVVAGFRPEVGAAVAVLICYALIARTRRPVPLLAHVGPAGLSSALAHTGTVADTPAEPSAATSTDPRPGQSTDQVAPDVPTAVTGGPTGFWRHGAWPWTVLITLVLVVAIGLAVWSAWHGLLDHHPLPAPLREPADVREGVA